MMIKTQLTFWILLIILTNQAFANDGLTKTEYKIYKTSECSVIALSIEIKDTSSQEHPGQTHVDSDINKVVLQMLNNEKVDPKTISNQDLDLSSEQTNFDSDTINSQIIFQLKNNSNITIYVKRPDYIDKIISLIPTQLNKEKAIKIFNENNYQIAVNVNQNMSINQGRKEKILLIEINIPILIKSATNLSLNPIAFKYDNTVYKTEKLNIKLEK